MKPNICPKHQEDMHDAKRVSEMFFWSKVATILMWHSGETLAPLQAIWNLAQQPQNSVSCWLRVIQLKVSVCTRACVFDLSK